MANVLDLLISVGILAAIVVLAPVLIWSIQGLKPKGKGGVGSALMDGFASVFETQQVRLQDAKREKNRGGRENADPPDLTG